MPAQGERRMDLLTTIGALALVIAGFLAGLLVFRAKAHWCARCGETLTCPRCMHRPSITSRSR